MKKYTIERTDPTHGRIMELTMEGRKEFITEDKEYGSCMDWIAKNQEELKVYKIARILYRKNAKRRFVTSIYAKDNNDAVAYFDTEFNPPEPNAEFQLLTGNWKIIAMFTVTNGDRNFTILN